VAKNRKRTKTKAELEAENRLLRSFRATDGLVSIFNNLIKWGGLVLIFKYLSVCIIALSGEVTTSDIVIQFLTDFKINGALACVLGGGSVAYGFSQNKLRKDTVKRIQNRNQQLEKRIDKKRSSSRLTSTGETRPEDMI
jgi:hypothetical protein